MNELTAPVWNRQVLAETLVAVTPETQARRFLGLVDTGSQRSAVSVRVIGSMETPEGPIEYLDVGGIGSSARSTPAYWLWLGIELDPGHGQPVPCGQQLSVWQLPPPAPPNFDILLGMDFLELFEIKHNDRTCTFTRD